MYDVINSRYTYKGTDVLVNKLDIKDEKKFFWIYISRLFVNE